MDIEWVLYHLIHNDSGFTKIKLEVDFYDDDVWERLLLSLQKNWTVTSVEVERYQDGEELRSQEELDALFHAVAKLPHLERLSLFALSVDDAAAAIPALGHEYLRYCRLDFTSISEAQPFPQLVVDTLSESPKLSELILEEPPSSGLLSLAPLIHSSSLEKLSIMVNDDTCLKMDVTAFMDALRDNRALRHLDLSYIVRDEHSLDVCQVLRQNSKLQTLALALSFQDIDSTRQVLDSLRGNKSLTKLINYTADSTAVDPEIRQAQIDMLEKNNHLQSFLMFHEDTELDRRKNMYLKLNSAGRAKFFQDSASLSDWVQVMTVVVDDLDCLFYCLTTNPSICQLDVPPSITTRKRKCPSCDANRRPGDDDHTKPCLCRFHGIPQNDCGNDKSRGSPVVRKWNA